MAHRPKPIHRLSFRLLAVLSVLSCPRTGSAAGTWTFISLPQQPGEVSQPWALAVDAAGYLYVADNMNSRILKRDIQGNWSTVATRGEVAGHVPGLVVWPTALAVDGAGSLYVADYTDSGWIQKRDPQGNWTILDDDPFASLFDLAVDAAGDLYLAGWASDFVSLQIQKRDTQGNWSILASGEGSAPGQFDGPLDIAVDSVGDLYVADTGNNGRIQMRDARGRWTVIATQALGEDYEALGLGHIRNVLALATDASGNLFVADARCPICAGPPPRIQKRDPQGVWSIVDPDPATGIPDNPGSSRQVQPGISTWRVGGSGGERLRAIGQ